MRLLIGCAMAQYVLALCSPSPWWVPDLVLVALILGVTRTPAKWLNLSICAGLLQALSAARHPAVLFVVDVLIGGLIWLAPRLADMSTGQLQRAAIGLSSIFMMGMMCWLDELWSVVLLGLLLWRLSLTLLSAELVRQVKR